MENVTLDRTTVLQLDADGTDGALDATADCDVLRNDGALCAPSPIRGSEARTSPLSRPKTCAGPLHSMLPTIDMSEPIQERVAAFAVGSRLGGGCSTTDCCCCTVLPTTSAAFVATSLSFSGSFSSALLLNMPTSVFRQHSPRPKLSSRDRARADAEPFTPRRGGPSG